MNTTKTGDNETQVQTIRGVATTYKGGNLGQSKTFQTRQTWKKYHVAGQFPSLSGNRHWCFELSVNIAFISAGSSEQPSEISR